ncbi:hypothetical protein BGZ80_000952 [Entomortierella chlamydospora]|uniref:Uncharacterized protein n=1 Tax=Entomortierella chlamydospora TaxID=101097 RepID=A0A9P6T3C2_9FUNG|nr:hypothetical protein BGZ80_000952 [Entomortierella chlamydospora]
MESSYGKAASVPDDDLILFTKALLGAAPLSRNYLDTTSVCARVLGPFATNFSSWGSVRGSLSAAKSQERAGLASGRVSDPEDYTCVEEEIGYTAGARLPAVGTPRDAVLDILSIEYWIGARPESESSVLFRTHVASTNREALAVAAVHILLDKAIHYRCANTKLEMAKFKADPEAKELAFQATGEPGGDSGKA